MVGRLWQAGGELDLIVLIGGAEKATAIQEPFFRPYIGLQKRPSITHPEDGNCSVCRNIA
jgi:hypothetical protein